MIIQRAFRTKLILNNKEKNYFYSCAAFARFVYNWGLADRHEMWFAYKSLSGLCDRVDKNFKNALSGNRFEQSKYFNSIKDKQFPWNREYPYKIVESSFRDLDDAFNNFFRRVKNGETAGYPKFKNKGSRKSFRLPSVGPIENDRINLKNRIGWVRLKEHGYLPTDPSVKINSATISEHAGEWYVSVQVEMDVEEPAKPQGESIGVDLGIKSTAVLSNGTVFDPPQPLRKLEKKLSRLQRELSRRQKFSKNWYKTKDKISALHVKISNIRRNHQHDVSSHIVYSTDAKSIAIEDLNVKGMMRRAKPILNEAGNGYAHNNAKAKSGLSKSLSDAGMGELRRQIEYKAEWNGAEIVKADRWYASSKLCSRCGHKNINLRLTNRVWVCDNCGEVLDRDLNAAKNLVSLAA